MISGLKVLYNAFETKYFFYFKQIIQSKYRFLYQSFSLVNR